VQQTGNLSIHHYRKETGMISLTSLSEKNLNDLENPQSQQDETNKIIKSLDKLLDSMKKNKSVISHMADSWGKLSAWLKIGGGLLVFGSLLVIGIIALSTILIASTCVCTLMYTLISLVLDNHYTTNKDEHDKLKARIKSLGSLLCVIIEGLNETSLKLSTEVDRLNASVDILNTLIEKTKIDFENEVTQLNEAVNTSRLNNEVLGRVVKTLSACFTENQEANKEFKDSLDQQLNTIKEGKEGFFQALGTLLSLEKNMEAITQRHEVLLEKYDALVVMRYQQQLEINSTKPSSTSSVQIEPVLSAGRVLNDIFPPSIKQNHPVYDILWDLTASCA
jgi:methyl-accepting chemotaxis protein